VSNVAATVQTAGHATYGEEVRELVCEHMGNLATLLMISAEHALLPGEEGPRPMVTRGERRLRLTIGTCSIVLDVEATIDMPEGASRAHEFPAGPARCTVQGPQGNIAHWDLRRANPGNTSLMYAWMVAGTDTTVGEPEIAAMVDHALACEISETRLAAAVPA
jgi:hypothetical protein